MKRRRRAAITEQVFDADGLSDSHVAAVAPEEYIEFKRPGLQHIQLQRLRQGRRPVEYILDLHGYSFDDARETLLHFISFCQNQHLSCVSVIHGKSHKAYSDSVTGHPGTMKSYVNIWLQQIPAVQAFSSCLPMDGGRGAVYVLLRKLR